MRKPLTVFLCSTFADLSVEREGVLEAVRRLQLQHDSMEFFGARAQQPIETCLEEVRGSDILVVIVGHRYGAIVPELGISFSEAEYAEGYRLEKPCLVYMRDDEVPVLPKHIERDPDKIRQLDRWKQTLLSRHTVARFTTGQALAVQVAADLGRTIQTLSTVEAARSQAPAKAERNVLHEVNSIVGDAVADGVAESDVLFAVRTAISSLLAQRGKRAPTVFLSYSRDDKKIVRRVAEGLRKAGIQVWFDEESIKLGSDFVEEIERGLDAADFVVVFISPGLMSSAWAQKELSFAMSRQFSGQRVPLIPILLADTDMPPLLRTIQYLDLRDGETDRAIALLVDAIRRPRR
jgi:hypothetical protein